MNFRAVLFCAFFSGLFAIPHLPTGSDVFEGELKAHFESFRIKFARKYVSSEEEAFRYSVFKANVMHIKEHNQAFDLGQESFQMEVNKFADMTNSEYNKLLGLKHRAPRTVGSKGSCTHDTITPPISIDWRSSGGVTPVKDQGQCGSCWTFSATGAIEGAWFVAKDSLLSLSEEEILQCDNDKDENGCDGGDMDGAFSWVIRNGGIATETEYPYISGTGITGNCSDKKLKFKEAHISALCDIEEGSEEDLEKAVSQQPVAVGIEADQKSFQFYAGGVLPARKCGVKLDHGVLVVGFGHDEKHAMDFWTVKNSWGPDWGEDGYIRLQKSPPPGNHSACGIALAASYPIV